jgi:beta-lactamase regulating signal transducer with metallopeptidase domain
MHSFSPLFAIILDTVLKSTVLLALAWGAALILKKRSAATQHMVRTFSLVAVLLLPFSVMLLPAWHVKGLPGFSKLRVSSRPVVVRPTPAAASPVTARPATSQTASPALAIHRADSGFRTATIRTATNRTNRSSSTHVVGPVTPSIVSIPMASVPLASPTTHEPPASTPSRSANLSAYLPRFLIGLWIAGALFFFAKWRLSTMRLAALVNRAGVLTDSGWNAQVRALSADLGISRHVALLVSDEIEVPITTGIFFPRIILSLDYPEWADTRRSAILNHELAHIKRLDALTQSLGHLATILYWFHPLVWLMVREMRIERERACDDHVLATGTKASDYAHDLLDIVSGLREPELAAALAMARRSQLEGRVLAVLNPALPRGSVSRKAALALAVLTLCIVLPLSALRPAPQQAANAPAAKATPQAGKKKPSPASPGSSANPNEASDSFAAPEAQSNESAESIEAPEPPEAPEMDAPEAPEAPEAFEPLEAPEPPEAPESAMIQGVPAVPAVPAVPSVPGVPSIPAVPSVPAVPAAPGGELSVCGTRAKMHNMSMESHDGYKRWNATWSGNDCNVDLHAEGEIKFNSDATDIQSISSGGSFEVNLRQGSTLKQIKITPSANGLQYVYKLNGNQQPFDGEAKTWFSHFLLDLERTTGFAADIRVPALLAKGGPTAVLDEISNLQSDYVRGIYFRKLLEQPNLPSPVVQRVIQQAGEQVHSDYELARVLMTVSKQYDLPDEASRTAFLNATGKLKSDYEHSRVLIELLHRPNISKENVRVALNSASGIKSDYEKSRILLSLLDQKSFDQSELDFYLKMVTTIQSDYEKSRDLLAPMQKYTLDADKINRIMDATSGINSDYEKSRLLLGLVKQGKFNEAQITNYLKVVDAMKSDYERSRSLLELMQNNTLSAPSVRRAIEDVSRSGSDYEKSRVLTTLVKASKFDESQMNTYISVMDSMSSDYERSRCLQALMENNKLSNASVGKVLDAASHIKSDYEKAKVLGVIARTYTLEGPLRDSYIKAAESITGEYERNRALAAVVKKTTL